MNLLEYFTKPTNGFDISYKRHLFKKDIIYVGDFKDGKYHGYGKKYKIFDNSKLNFLKNSYDHIKHNEIEYEGNFLNGNHHGEGILYDYVSFRDVILRVVKYRGNFKNGMYNGYGKLYFQPSNKHEVSKEFIKYEGEFCDGIYHGYGILYKYFENGVKSYEKLYSGEFKDGVYDGIGRKFIIEDNNDHEYEGEFKHGKYNGIGTIYVYRGKSCGKKEVNEKGDLCYKITGKYKSNLKIGLHIRIVNGLAFDAYNYNDMSNEIEKIYYYKNEQKAISLKIGKIKRYGGATGINYSSEQGIDCYFRLSFDKCVENVSIFYRLNESIKYRTFYPEKEMYKNMLYYQNKYTNKGRNKLFYKNKKILFY